MRLDDHPVAAAVAARRAAGALEVPLVVVLAGPRCEVVEGLLGEQDLVLVVTGDPDGPLARLAVAGCAAPALAHGPCGPGPARWIALAGLAGARGLAVPARGLVRELAAPPAIGRPRGDRVARRPGQASILLVGGLAGVLVGALVLGAVSRAVGARGRGAAGGGPGGAGGRAGDARGVPAAVRAGGARRPAEPAASGQCGVPRARAGRGERAAAANGAGGRGARSRTARRSRPSGSACAVRERVEVGAGARGDAGGRAARGGAGAARPGGLAAGGGYDGPLAYRQGKPMRPDVAQAFDRMERAARADGVALLITSALPLRRRAGGAVAPPPGPASWVAPPGRVAAPLRHRARPRPARRLRLARGATPARFHFVQRYSWEPWHFGYALNAALGAAGARRARAAGGEARAARASSPDALRARARPRGAALERLGGAARRAAVCGEQLQPVRRQPGGRAGDRAVHARDRAGDGPRRPVRRRRRRSTPRRG